VLKIWSLVDHVLRSRLAQPSFFFLLRSEIRRDKRAIQAVNPSKKVRPRLVIGLSETKRRICLGEGFAPVSRIRHSPSVRNPDAPQFLIDAILDGDDSLESFLALKESGLSTPVWTAETSRQRVAAIRVLLQVDPERFEIWVTSTGDGHFEVLDGNHRLRLARIRGLIEMKVIFFLKSPTIDWTAPRSIFLNRLIDRRKNHSGL
jgi:hypothetical protein